MTYNQFKNECSKFENSNLELIKEYDDIAIVNFENATQEMWDCYVRYSSVIKNYGVEQFLKSLIRRSVENETDFLDEFNTFFNEDAIKREPQMNFVQMYFDEVKSIYDKHDNDYNIEYCEENRDRLIEMNLKTVISIAKKFKGRGVPFEDLISAGNLGLCRAFEKYDPERSVAKQKILEIISKLSDGDLDVQLIKAQLGELIHYGNVKKKLFEFLEGKTTTNKKELIKWAKTSVHSAKFNSVASMWIKAYIIEELNSNSRPVKKPKSEITKELNWYSENSENPYRDKFIYLDDTLNCDTDTTYNEVVSIPDDTTNDADNMQSIKYVLDKLLDGVESRDRRIILQKFGIGYPRELTPKEIADREDLSTVRVCQIVNEVLETMKRNQTEYNIDSKYVWSLF